MLARSLLGAVAALAVLVPGALAQDVVPLAGKGENIQPIARVKIPGVNEIELAGDWAFLSVEKAADGKAGGGLVIVNIADPAHPFVQGRWEAASAGIEDAAYGDVDLSPDGNLAVLTNAHCSDCTEGKNAWVVVIDISDKANPKLLGKIIDDDTIDYVHTSTLDNKTLYLNPQVAAFYPQPGNAHITVFDISDPAHPVKKGVIAPPGADLGLAHDSYIDHRPDGRDLMYAASISKSDVLDITDPLGSTWLQSTTSTYTISHDVQPNHDRSIIVVDDEGALGGQLDESVSACGKVGSGPASVDSGSIHFFQAAPDGTFANGGAVHLGSFNAPANVNTGACVAHVFWQAPDENRLTQAYYRTGAFAIDFENPADPKMLGWFLADGGAEYWSNKPHRGYLYASDMEHGLDILKYTGEDGKGWPATAGQAEIQRSARQGVPYVPIAGVSTTKDPIEASAPSSGIGSGGEAAPASRAGRLRLTIKVKRVPGRPGRRKRLSITFSDARGKRVERLRVRRAAGRKANIAVRGVAEAGRYRWTVRARRRTIRRGSVTVQQADGLSISPGAQMVARAR